MTTEVTIQLTDEEAEYTTRVCSDGPSYYNPITVILCKKINDALPQPLKAGDVVRYSDGKLDDPTYTVLCVNKGRTWLENRRGSTHVSLLSELERVR